MTQAGVDFTQELPETPPAFTFDRANAIRPRNPALLAAIEARRTIGESLAEIKYRLTAADGKLKDQTVMVLQPTRHGLQYFHHAATPHDFGKTHEAGLWLFGMASVVHWVWFSPDPPARFGVSIEQGRLFSADSGFTIRQVDPAGGVTRTRCEPRRRYAASAVLASLRGDAIEFACVDTAEGEGESRRDVAYLDRYGQYIPLVNYDQSGGVATRFEVVGATVRKE